MARVTDPVVRLGAAGRADTLLACDHRLLYEAPAEGAFSVWASGEACSAALQLAAELPERVSALVLEAPTGQPDLELLAAVRAPTLVAFGTEDAAENGRVYRETMPNCHFVLVYAAGRDIATDRPEAFVSLISDFLTRRERFIVTERSGLLHP